MLGDFMKDEQKTYESKKRVKSGSELVLILWGISLVAWILDMPQGAKVIFYFSIYFFIMVALEVFNMKYSAKSKNDKSN
jgi:hypothetical protein